ncbi:V-set and transmembrane domain-containing protein 5-like isoform X1 [Leucoraja erinacea]|uniref:V-set and transmembrane domain-containing protein 5-like isoform X1 n=1 Tax=Leucoraja erinaceus TaxID=7782 RepID=UPI0024558AC1|nr:V-set and transmembrane domain-containing protein 5-like isoform X1 [Leucoraja erinacea]
MYFILQAAVLLAHSMNVLPCANELSINATLGEDVLLNPNCTDCDALSIEWKFSSNLMTSCISSYIMSKETISKIVFGAFEGRVSILRNGLHLWLPSVHINDTGKYTRILTTLNGMEQCVSITVNVQEDSRKAETFEINQTKDNGLKTTISLSVSIVGVILGVIIILLWIKRKSAWRATSRVNRFSLPTKSREYPIYGNWNGSRYT